ncbi:BZ3500_MvSof-1268-A1-R1_Chr11-3g03536 [Microbotryum saponariae]|uniref:BZ3500_MvSof-1268-A1-R1_Chr11-3g03536 protein n=1 Tax=Microbotryum saponariae TaxID=289078 RepID=A0A2X0MRB7_9BASI|nr:BZ3500_MvSof-1268-A1-R1_Chr11-3g03536 [Microbotryum saponariae]SDA03545.1 BZ3501_MvSof-1269-A2-R1_Chr11g03113 [Microbotryum saponariae]
MSDPTTLDAIDPDQTSTQTTSTKADLEKAATHGSEEESSSSSQAHLNPLRQRGAESIKLDNAGAAPVQVVRSAALTAAVHASGKMDIRSRGELRTCLAARGEERQGIKDAEGDDRSKTFSPAWSCFFVDAICSNTPSCQGAKAKRSASSLILSTLCTANGFDGSLMASINNMAAYQRQFNAGLVGSTTGIIFAIYTIGQMFGSMVSAPIADHFGRRIGMQVGCVGIVLGSIVATTSQAKAQFIAGRFILGFGIAITTTASPSYCVEIAPPSWRGRATGAYNCGWFAGSIPAAGITLGTSYIHSNWAWRIPVLAQCFPACVVIATVMFLPESPRWLIAQGRGEEARAFLVKYHGNGDPASAIVELEWSEMVEDIRTDASDKRWWDFSELFRTKNARWRSLMVGLMSIAGQFSGNGLGYFNFQIYSYVGYSKVMQFILNLVNTITSAIGAGIGASLADSVRRRPILVWGTLACAFWLAMNGMATHLWATEGLTAHSLNIGRFAIASFFLFNIVYSFTYSPLQALYAVECLQTNTRAKGMAAYAFFVSCVSFINTYAIPIALENIEYNLIWFFVGWDCIEALAWYYLGVETQGRTLEELETIFSAPHPVRASKANKQIAIDERGNTIVEALV